jgi:DNA-binding response OmpR family regulator
VVRILIVEDDSALANGLVGALAQSGYLADIAHDGRSAIAACSQTVYQLVILDLSLPDRDGLDVLQCLRREGLDAPVLILTARDDLQDRIAGLDAGSDDYLGKPFELAELEARIRALLRRSQQGESALHYGAIALDPVSHVVTIKGCAIDLTSREFAVLEALLRRPKGIVSKRQLFDSLYDFADDVSPSVIESFVSRLRGKLAEADSDVGIRVLRGLGYRLELLPRG